MSYVEAKCTNCGGKLQLDENLQTGYCMHCGSKLVVKDAIELKKVEIEGKVSVEGVSSVENLITRGEQSLEIAKYDKALEFFQQAINIDAKNHKAWWGKFVAQYNSVLKVKKVKRDAFSINGKVFRIDQDIETNSMNDALYAKRVILRKCVEEHKVGLIPYLDDECIDSAKRAIEYADSGSKDKYNQELRLKMAPYEEMKKWSYKTLRVLVNKESSKKSGPYGIAALIGVIGIIAVVIGFFLMFNYTYSVIIIGGLMVGMAILLGIISGIIDNKENRRISKLKSELEKSYPG